MRIVFMGTPDFAVPTLESLLESEHQVVGVVTQPDKPKGRGGKVQMTPVKELAVKYDVPVHQPVRIKEKESYGILKQWNPDAIVVVAFGQILPKRILDLPQYGCINVHASLLPKLRGAAPIQWAVIEGEKTSGVTTMYMDEGLDTGDMLLKEEISLADTETGGSLHDKLMVLGGPLILRTLEGLQEGTIARTPQNHSEHTYAKMLDKQLGKLDFTKPASEIERLIRGLNPWPSAYTSLGGKTLKIWEAKVVPSPEQATPGEIVETAKSYITVQTGEDALQILSLQLEGKKRMSTEAFLRGVSLEQGLVLGK